MTFQRAFSSSRRQQDTNLSEQRRQAVERFVRDKGIPALICQDFGSEVCEDFASCQLCHEFASRYRDEFGVKEKPATSLRQDLESRDSVAISTTVKQLGTREAAIKTFIEKDNLEKDGDIKTYVEKTKLGKDQELDGALRGATYEEVKPLITYYRQKAEQTEKDRKKDGEDMSTVVSVVVALVAIICCTLGAMLGPAVVPFVGFGAALLFLF